MTGVIHATRRILLSCTRLSRGFFFTTTSTLLATASPASAQGAAGSDIAQLLVRLTGLNNEEIAALTLVLAILGFSVVAAILLMRTRTRATANESRLRAQIQSLQRETDRSNTLLLAEPQVIVSWPAAEDQAQIVGDVSLLLPPGVPQRLLAFGAWLAPEPSLRLEHSVQRLRNQGEAFTLNLTTLSGRAIEASGRVIGGQAVMRLRELSGLRRDLAELTLRHNRLREENETLRSFAEAVPYPVWARRADGALSFANAAYAEATEAASADDALARNLELLESAERQAMAHTLADKRAFDARVPVVVRGARRIYDVHAMAAADGSAGIALDVSEAEALRASLAQMAEAHRRTLDQLSCGVAAFDSAQNLAFYNESYCRLWGLDPAFLDTRPSDSAILDRLRGMRKLPEQQDFKHWKARLSEAYRAVEARQEQWHLPDGRTLSVVTTPNQEGGVTYLFDDVTERFDLARRYDALISVQRETLDNLGEAVAVFGSNGRMRLFNPSFLQMWQLSAEALEQRPHIRDVEAWCRPLFGEAAVWQKIGAAITGIEQRIPVSMQLERNDGSVLDCTTTPLPDGATLLTFQDVTASVNVERALRERAEALETADKMKVEFVHHVSYELRSPLTTLAGFVYFLGEPSTGPLTPKQAEYLSYINTSTNALLALIDNFLDLATIDAGAMTLELGRLDIRRTIEAAAEGVQDRLASEHIRLDVAIAPGVENFIGDESRVKQVLYNLLANAVGFSPENSTIRVAVQRSADRIVFSVTDSGPGIPDEFRDKVFNWFESRSNGSRHRGAGLGLSLVRSFVQLHGGSVHIESAPGKGTTVSCDFPVDQHAQRNAAE
mgnify:FL=1